MKSVYTGGEKVAEFESYDELRVGDGKPAFIYEGSELVYPNPVKDGLVLWYDFSGRTNTDGQRGIAEDLSGNGNHGTLQNFNYTTESGYEKNKLLFDGVDDEIAITTSEPISQMTYLMSVDISNESIQFFNTFSVQAYYLRKQNANLHFSAYSDSDAQVSIRQPVFDSSERHRVSVGFILDRINNQVELIANGIPLGKVELRELTPTRITHLGRWVTKSDSLDGSILSTHIYNRVLTPEEIAHNYAIEKERFNIGGAE